MGWFNKKSDNKDDDNENYDITYSSENSKVEQTRYYEAKNYQDYKDPLVGMIDHILKSEGSDTKIVEVKKRD